MINEANISSLTVVMMEVPCCGGLLQIARIAREKAGRDIKIRKIYLSVKGQVIGEEWD